MLLESLILLMNTLEPVYKNMKRSRTQRETDKSGRGRGGVCMSEIDKIIFAQFMLFLLIIISEYEHLSSWGLGV